MLQLLIVNIQMMSQNLLTHSTIGGCKEQRMLGQSFERVYLSQLSRTRAHCLVRRAIFVILKLGFVDVWIVVQQLSFANPVQFQNRANSIFFIVLKF